MSFAALRLNTSNTWALCFPWRACFCISCCDTQASAYSGSLCACVHACMRACVQLRDFVPDFCSATRFSFSRSSFLFFCCHCCAPIHFVSLPEEQESKSLCGRLRLMILICTWNLAGHTWDWIWILGRGKLIWNGIAGLDLARTGLYKRALG